MRRDGTSETARKRGPWRRLRLRRADGRVYLDRWGIAHDRIGGVLVHRMTAPDPGIDLHDHPWWFASLVVWGGYREEIADTREAPALARKYADLDTRSTWGRDRRPFSVATTRLDQCHTIRELHRRSCWTIVLRGPRRRGWGFYLSSGYVDEATYDRTVRVDRRDLWNEVGS